MQTRSSILRIIFLICLTSLFSFAQASDPLAFDELVTSLKESKVGLPTANRILKKQVEDRGLAFEISERLEAELRNAGAPDELLTTIRFWFCDKYTELADRCSEDDIDCRIANYTRALEFHPDDDVVLIDRGNAFHDKGDYSAAIRDYTEAIRIMCPRLAITCSTVAASSQAARQHWARSR